MTISNHKIIPLIFAFILLSHLTYAQPSLIYTENFVLDRNSTRAEREREIEYGFNVKENAILRFDLINSINSTSNITLEVAASHWEIVSSNRNTEITVKGIYDVIKPGESLSFDYLVTHCVEDETEGMSMSLRPDLTNDTQAIVEVNLEVIDFGNVCTHDASASMLMSYIFSSLIIIVLIKRK